MDESFYPHNAMKRSKLVTNSRSQQFNMLKAEVERAAAGGLKWHTFSLSRPISKELAEYAVRQFADSGETVAYWVSAMEEMKTKKLTRPLLAILGKVSANHDMYIMIILSSMRQDLRCQSALENRWAKLDNLETTGVLMFEMLAMIYAARKKVDKLVSLILAGLRHEVLPRECCVVASCFLDPSDLPPHLLSEMVKDAEFVREAVEREWWISDLMKEFSQKG